MAEPGKRPNRPTHTGTVTVREQLSPSMVRLTIRSASVADGSFVPNGCTDAYFKLVLPDAQGDDVMRTYTVRRWLVAESSFEADFMVHGVAGLAGPWARDVQVGGELRFRGPGGGYAPDPGAGSHLYVADLAALPAVEAALDVLPTDAVGHVVVVHDDPEDVRDVATSLTVQWVVDPDLSAAYDKAVGVVEGLPDLPELQAFVHGEAGFVRKLRPHLRIDRAVPAARLSISGYWKQGRTDEVWRTEKKDWMRPVNDREAQLDPA